MLSHKPDFHLSLTRFFNPGRKSKIFTRGPRSALRELRTQIRWRKIRYSVASLLTNPVSSSTQPQGIISNTPQKFCGVFAFFAPREKSEIFPAGTPFVPAALPHKVSSLCGGTLRGPRCVSAKEKCKTFAPLLVLSLCSETIALLSDFCSAGWRLPPHFYRKASLATPRRNLWGVRVFCPTRKIRDFSRGDPVCACGFAPQSVLALLRYFAGTPLCFRKRKMQDVRLLRVFSLCLETTALLSDFCSAGWAAPAACSFF